MIDVKRKIFIAGWLFIFGLNVGWGFEGTDNVIDVLIKTSDVEVLRSVGVEVRTTMGDIVTASMPMSLMSRVSYLPSVSRIELTATCRPLLDESLPEIGVDRVHDGDLGTAYRGTGVIVGIYDSGIDWSHPDFIDEDGNSRILYLWDQTADGDPPAEYGYGVEFDQTAIRDEINGVTVGIVQGMDTWGHGTHVAGIAAGNGRGTGNGQTSLTYIGVAPEADLIVVKGGDDVFTTDRILDGLAYIFETAEALDRPVAVNLSVGGTHKGPHDGSSLFEQAVDAMLIGHYGRALVVPAGNEGNDNIHFHDVFSSADRSDTVRISFEVPQNTLGIEDYARFDVWHPVSTHISLTVVTPSGERVGPMGDDPQYQYASTEGDIAVTAGNSGDDEMVVWLSDAASSDNLATGTWQLLFAGDPGWVDGWLYESTMGASVTQGATQSTLVAEPGNAYAVITVGSYVSRMEWPSLWSDPFIGGDAEIGSLSAFSSPGPTRSRGTIPSNPRNKPDISAPGEYILSTLSSETAEMPTDHYIATDGVHRAMRGTSMAAPHVTGVAALMLEADPTLSPSSILGRLIQTARKDGFTGSTWSASWGYGKLDGYAAVGSVSPVEDDPDTFFPSAYSLSQNYPNPFNGETVIEFVVPDVGIEIHIDVYGLSGRRVCELVSGQEQPGSHTVRWDGRDDGGRTVGSGVYFVRLTAGRVRLSRKMILME